MKKFLKKIVDFLKKVWDRLPKEGKVAVYLFGAAVLEQISKDIRPEFFSFIPLIYRLAIFNLIEVFLVEMVKRLKALT